MPPYCWPRRYLAKSTSHCGFLVLSTPTKPPASKIARPANCELVVGRADPSTYLHLLSLKSAAATRPNLHSLNSWPAVQCNEGFCNASEGQRLPLTTTMASQKPHHSANRPDVRFGSKPVIAVMSAARPLFPQEQTFAATHRTSVSRQSRPNALQQTSRYSVTPWAGADTG